MTGWGLDELLSLTWDELCEWTEEALRLQTEINEAVARARG